jgi:hypothetical protein
MPSLRLGLGLGSGFTRIAVQHLHSDKTTRTAHVEELLLSNSDNRETCGIKSVALYKDDETLIWGKDVNNAVRVDSNLQSRVLEISNLALHSNFDHVAEVIHVKDVLNVETDPAALENFFKDLLGCIAQEVRDVFNAHASTHAHLRPILNPHHLRHHREKPQEELSHFVASSAVALSPLVPGEVFEPTSEIENWSYHVILPVMQLKAAIKYFCLQFLCIYFSLC